MDNSTRKSEKNDPAVVKFDLPTPGPWRVDRRAATRVFADGDNTVAATACAGDLKTQWEANARLIAAAPDMLEALQAVEPLMIPGMNWTDETGELIKTMVRTALAKAIP